MSTNYKSIAIITPMKNEMESLPGLINAMESQSVPITLWIVLDDASKDGSGEYIRENIVKLRNVRKALYCYITEMPEEYMLGDKYSDIISFGFDKLNQYQESNKIKFDYIGILDADCKLEKNYYLNLLKKFQYLKKLGIASGIIYYYCESGKKIFERAPQRWARGGIRIWRRECFEKCGYIRGKAADALSTAFAWRKGWQTQSFRDSLAESRETGVRVRTTYYGETAYYRYVPLYYVIIKCLLQTLIGKYKVSKIYLSGYILAMNKKDRKKISIEIIRYFRLLPLRILIENLIVARNKLIILINQLRK